MAVGLRRDGQRRLSRQLHERENSFPDSTLANALPNTKVFYAGTARVGEQVVTNGGRVHWRDGFG